MTGKAYYLTTLADWQRHAPRFSNSHFILLDAHEDRTGAHATIPDESSTSDQSSASCGVRELAPALSSPKLASAPSVESRGSIPKGEVEVSPANNDAPQAPSSAQVRRRILVLIEADEGVHLSLEDDSAFEPLPHPLAQKPISAAAQSALAPHGVAPGSTTFDAAETLARIHPLLKHRVF